jgi:unsaturated rhamnogalacturonyl hydrolase
MPGSAEAMLAGLLASLAENMTPEGMLMQLPLRKGLADNYPESSGTLLFAYSAMKAARLGIVGADTGAAGKKAFDAVSEGYINFGPDGMPVLGNICLMAGLGGEPFRDGSAGYYLSEQIVENDAKGIAPYLMAYAESCMQ